MNALFYTDLLDKGYFSATVLKIVNENIFQIPILEVYKNNSIIAFEAKNKFSKRDVTYKVRNYPDIESSNDFNIESLEGYVDESYMMHMQKK